MDDLHGRGEGQGLPVSEIVAFGGLVELALTDADAEQLKPAVDGLLKAWDQLQSVAGIELPPSPFLERDPGRRPSPAEDPWNAFIRRCEVPGADFGPLFGKTVGVKDNIDVAGVPTSNASPTTSYVPTRDAIVVERILAAGGRVIGKLNMDDFGYGATGESSAYGTPRNPKDATRSPGGSSGGSGSAVASGAVDLALGVDQGGSARIPASYCGVVAIKPTHGLVPTQGITHIDHTLDHICPMGATVDDAALLLEAVAGDDWRDPQWVRGPVPETWRCDPGHDVSGLRVGVVLEGVDSDRCDPDVVRNLRSAAEVLRRAGADVRDISISMWPHGLPIVQALESHLAAAMIGSEGVGYGRLGIIDIDRLHAFAHVRRTENKLLSPYMKACMVVERYLHDTYLNVPYGKLHNLRLRLRQDLDKAMDVSDLLLTPTTPTVAPKLATGDLAFSETSRTMLEEIPYNTAPLNLSGHPAVAVPSGWDDADLGLPTSVQIIARRFHESVAIKAGRLIEASLT
jgi:amidase